MAMVNIPVEPRLTEYLHIKASQARIPLSGTFELTPVCNMACKMCYVRMAKEDQEAIRPLRTADEWLGLAKAAKEKGMLYLLLTGGEPFLYPEFRALLPELHRMGLVISINSNGTMIDEETIGWLKETPPSRVNLTLYGATDETYGRLCGNPHGFTQAVNAVRLLRDAGILVKINVSLTPYNASDLKGIMDFCKSESLVVQATSYMFPPLRRAPSMVGRNDRFSPEEAAYYAARIESLMNGEEEFLRRMEAEDLAGLPSDPEEGCLETEGEGIRCRAGKCSFWVTWEGKFLPCGMLPPEGAPDVFRDGFGRSWEQVTGMCAAIRLPAECKACSLKDQCRACAAMVLTESGGYATVPEYRCRMSHAYLPACREVAEEIRRYRNLG